MKTTYQVIVEHTHRTHKSFEECTEAVRQVAEALADSGHPRGHEVICDLIDLAQGKDRNAQGFCLKCGTPHSIHEQGCPVAYNEREAVKPRASVVDAITSIAAELEADRPGFTVDDLAEAVGADQLPTHEEKYGSPDPMDKMYGSY